MAECGSVLAAAEKAYALIQEKLRKGYGEVNSTASAHIAASSPPKAAAASKSAQPAERVGLTDAAGDKLVMGYYGRYVLLGDGPGRGIQDLASSTKAEAHFKVLSFLLYIQGLHLQRHNLIQRDNSVKIVSFRERFCYWPDRDQHLLNAVPLWQLNQL